MKLVLLLFFFFFQAFSNNCFGTNYFQLDGWCYKRQSSDTDWMNAQNICKNNYPKGHLASFTDQNEIDEVLSRFPDRDYWFGLNMLVTAEWMYTDGYHEEEPNYFTNWDTNHPDDTNSNYVNKCGRMVITTGKWRAADCSSVYEYICKFYINDTRINGWDNVTYGVVKDPSYSSGTSEIMCNWKDPGSNCPSSVKWKCIDLIANGGYQGAFYSNTSGQCFRIYNTDITWYDSNTYCKNFHPNATLATIRNKRERHAIARHTPHPSTNNWYGWVGATNRGRPGAYYWISPFHTHDSREDLSTITDYGWATTRNPDQNNCVYMNAKDVNGAPSQSSCTLTDRRRTICAVQFCGDDTCTDVDEWRNVLTGTRVTCDYETTECPDDIRYAWHCLNRGGNSYNGRCLWGSGTLVDWATGEANCRAAFPGAHLASYNEFFEYEFVDQRHSGSDFWFGLNDIAKEFQHTYTNGKPVTYMNWTPSKNNAQNCVMTSGTGTWNDRNCDDLYGYACSYDICDSFLECPDWQDNEWENVEYYPITGPVGQIHCDYTTKNCPEIFTSWNNRPGTWECMNRGGLPIEDPNEPSGSCVLFFDINLNWDESELYCRENVHHTAHLLTFDQSSYAFDQINYYMHVTLPHFDSYVGLNAFDKWGFYEFTNGALYNNTEEILYGWASGHPNYQYRCSAKYGTRHANAQLLRSSSCASTNAQNFYCQYPMDFNEDVWDNVYWRDTTTWQPQNLFCDLTRHECPEKYQTCFGYHYSDINVCGGNRQFSYLDTVHGICSSYNNCTCFDGYLQGNVYKDWSANCHNWTCNGIALDVTEGNWYNHTIACGNGDICIDHDECHCFNDKGHECHEWMCNNTWRGDPNVCNGHGTCIWRGGLNNLYDQAPCICDSNLYTLSYCERWSCFGIENNDPNVCSGHGTCVDVDTCTCDFGYQHGKHDPIEQCSSWKCFLVDKEDQEACSNKGTCVDYNSCGCQFLFSGTFCQEDNSSFFYTTMAIVVVSIVGVMCCIVIIILIMILVVAKIQGKKGGSGYRNVQKANEIDDEEMRRLEKEHETKEGKEMAKFIINKSLFEIDYDSVQLVKLIGKGGSNSSVFQGRMNDVKVAFKIYKVSNDLTKSDNFVEFEKEVSILSSISHPNVVHFYGCSLKPPRVGIVTEFCSFGDLENFFSVVKSDNEETDLELTLDIKYRILKEIASAMDYLHNKRIYHRDLKAQNVLINEHLTAKLTDFGLSKLILEKGASKKTKRIGTSHYMAPEVCLGRNYDEKCDVFSFGMVIFEVLEENFSPYGTQVIANLELKIANDPYFRPKMAEEAKYEKWVLNLMKSCWSHESPDRPSFGEVSKTLQMMVKDFSEKEGLKKQREKHVLKGRNMNQENKARKKVMKEDGTEVQSGAKNVNELGHRFKIRALKEKQKQERLKELRNKK